MQNDGLTNAKQRGSNEISRDRQKSVLTFFASPSVSISLLLCVLWFLLYFSVWNFLVFFCFFLLLCVFSFFSGAQSHVYLYLCQIYTLDSFLRIRLECATHAEHFEMCWAKSNDAIASHSNILSKFYQFLFLLLFCLQNEYIDLVHSLGVSVHAMSMYM